MMRISIAIGCLTLATLATLATTAGCKGEKVIQIDQQTKTDLEQCQKDKLEKDKLIKAVEEENARLMRNQGSGAEIVVSIEGKVLTVKPGKPGDVRPIDDAVAAAASKEFINVVEKSRGAIQKCYEQALKKNTGLQARTVKLTVSASFSQAGAYKHSSFSPSLGDTFDNCMRAVASRWELPANSPAMTFRAPVSLTPS